MVGMDWMNIVQQEDREADSNNLHNLHTAKLRVTTTNQLNSENKKNSDNTTILIKRINTRT